MIDLAKPLSCYACTEQAKCWVSMQDLSNLVSKLSTNCQQLLSRLGRFQLWGSCCFCRWPYPIHSLWNRTKKLLSWKLLQLLTFLLPIFITSWWEMSWTALFYKLWCSHPWNSLYLQNSWINHKGHRKSLLLFLRTLWQWPKDYPENSSLLYLKCEQDRYFSIVFHHVRDVLLLWLSLGKPR